MCACNPPVCFSIRFHVSSVALYACMRVYSQVVHMQERARLDFGLRLASLIGLKKYVPFRAVPFHAGVFTRHSILSYCIAVWTYRCCSHHALSKENPTDLANTLSLNSFLPLPHALWAIFRR